MKTTLTIFAAALFGISAFAAPPPPDSPRPARGSGADLIILRLLERPQFKREIGISSETAEAIRAEIGELAKQQKEIFEKMRETSQKQKETISRHFTDKTLPPDELMKIVDEVGELRKQIAVNAIQKMLVIRNHLTNEQLLKTEKALKEEIARLKRKPADI